MLVTQIVNKVMLNGKRSLAERIVYDAMDIIGTKTGEPAVQTTNTLYFNLFLPMGTPPEAGWPVAIFGHGFGDTKNNSPFVVAEVMAQQGIATIAIDVVGGQGITLQNLLPESHDAPLLEAAHDGVAHPQTRKLGKRHSCRRRAKERRGFPLSRTRERLRPIPVRMKLGDRHQSKRVGASSPG